MRCLVTKNGGYTAELVDYPMAREGRTYDDALYNLQVAMAARMVDCAEKGVEHVWVPEPSTGEAEWNSAQPQMYCEHVFRFVGKKIELPTLEVRVYDL